MMSHSRRGRRAALTVEKAVLTRPVQILLRRLSHYLGPHRRGFMFGALFTALFSASAIIAPIILANGIDLIDNGLANNRTGLNLAALFLILTIFGWIMQSISTRILAKTQARMIFDIRKDLFDTLLVADLNYLKREQSGNVTARITGDTEEIGGGLSILISSSVQILVLIGSFFIIILKVHWLIALVTLASIPVALILSTILSHFGRRIVSRIRSAFGEVSGKMAENFAGVTVSKAFNREEESAAELKKLNLKHYNYNKQFILLMRFMWPTINSIGTITTAVILIVGGHLYQNGTLSLGEIYLAIVLAQRFLMPVINVSMSWPQLQSALGAIDRVLDVLERKPSIVDSPLAVSLQTEEDSIHFNNVSFAYIDENYVLENVNFTIQPGEMMAVVGETGAGKTTLFTALLPRFYDPQEGSICIGKQDIRTVKLNDLRQSIGMILQEPYLFTASILDNIRYAAPESTDTDIRDLCELIGADEFINALPLGYNTIVREGGKQLSTGQRQMITIARTMLSNPRILVLDEATSRLDAYSESLVQRAQEILFKNRTTIVIAHRLSTIRNADRIIALDKGKLAEIGSHDELIAKGGIYANLFQTYYSFQGFTKVKFSESEWEELEREEREEVARVFAKKSIEIKRD